MCMKHGKDLQQTYSILIEPFKLVLILNMGLCNFTCTFSLQPNKYQSVSFYCYTHISFLLTTIKLHTPQKKSFILLFSFFFEVKMKNTKNHIYCNSCNSIITHFVFTKYCFQIHFSVRISYGIDVIVNNDID